MKRQDVMASRLTELQSAKVTTAVVQGVFHFSSVSYFVQLRFGEYYVRVPLTFVQDEQVKTNEALLHKTDTLRASKVVIISCALFLSDTTARVAS